MKLMMLCIWVLMELLGGVRLIGLKIRLCYVVSFDPKVAGRISLIWKCQVYMS
jgi:hypothetical protein